MDVQKNSQLLANFEPHFDKLLQLMLELKADPLIRSQCSCGVSIATTRCNDCMQYMPMCETCFIKFHQMLSCHWAEVWNTEHGYFVHKDISNLGHVI